MAKAPCLSSEAESARGTIDSCADHKPLLARRSQPYVAKEATMHELNGADGISDIEGKATRVGASERGQRTSFNPLSLTAAEFAAVVAAEPALSLSNRSAANFAFAPARMPRARQSSARRSFLPASTLQRFNCSRHRRLDVKCLDLTPIPRFLPPPM
jgi:hypothetical protein